MVGKCVICRAVAPGLMLCGEHESLATLGGLVLAGMLTDWPTVGTVIRATHRDMMTDGIRRGLSTWQQQVPQILSELKYWLDDGPTESGATAA